MWHQLGIVALAAALCGCSETPDQSREKRRLSDGTAAEAGLHSQLKAVRRGLSDRIDLTERPATADDLEAIHQHANSVHHLSLRVDGGSDLSVLSGFDRLQTLKLFGPVSDEQIRSIAGLENLEILNTPDGRFTDEALKALQQTKLTFLRFHSPQVTDAGMSHIAEMRSLRFLHLIDVPITDAGLKPLEAMTWLESFYLDGGRTTDQGLRELLAVLPELHFHKDQLHLPNDPNRHD